MFFFHASGERHGFLTRDGLDLGVELQKAVLVRLGQLRESFGLAADFQSLRLERADLGLPGGIFGRVSLHRLHPGTVGRVGHDRQHRVGKFVHRDEARIEIFVGRLDLLRCRGEPHIAKAGLHASRRRFCFDGGVADGLLALRCRQRLLDLAVVDILADHHASDQKDAETHRDGEFRADADIGDADHWGDSRGPDGGRDQCKATAREREIAVAGPPFFDMGRSAFKFAAPACSRFTYSGFRICPAGFRKP